MAARRPMPHTPATTKTAPAWRFASLTFATGCLLACLFNAPQPAAATLPASPHQAQATTDLNALIDGLQRKYARMTAIAADFTQVYQGTDGRTIREGGRVILKRPGRARWEYTSPERKLFVADGRDIYFYVYGERQASKTSVKASADPQIPFLFLLGRGDLRKDFSRIELLNDERAVESGNRVLRLLPKRAPEEFRRLLVEVNPTTLQVKRLVIFERNGARMDFMLANTVENPVVAESAFRFTAPAGVSIVER